MSSPNEETARLQSDGSNILLAEGVSPSISRIGHTVDAVLEETLWRLIRAEISLFDLTPALQSWWVVAAEEGRKSANSDRIERLEWLASYWYFRATNPGVDYYRAATERLWQEAVAA
jgi:hypothetical protein